jgi:hypothetical protein
VKQEIITDVANDEDVVIKYGLAKGDELYLTIPDNSADLPIVNLAEKDKKAHEKELAEAERKIAEAAKRREKEMEERMKAFENK